MDTVFKANKSRRKEEICSIKTAKVLFLFLFVRKYTFSTPDKKKNP